MIRRRMKRLVSGFPSYGTVSRASTVKLGAEPVSLTNPLPVVTLPPLLMATLVRPELLLLDEHTSALDPRSTEQVVQLTAEIIRKEGLTTLMVTHSMQQAVAFGDRVVLMHRGRIVESIGGARKRQLRVEELLDSFDRLRNADLVDDSAADMLRRLYV